MRAYLGDKAVSWLATSMLVGLLVSCTCQPAPKDAIEKLADRYGVEREQVQRVADDLNVSSTEIERFGSCPFPCNYYEYQFGLFKQEHDRYPYRSEVEQMMDGYVAKCDADYAGMVQYIYYAQTGWEGLVLEIAFESPPPNQPEPEDPLFSHIQIVELQDRSVNPRSETYWNDCIHKYLNEPGESNQ